MGRMRHRATAGLVVFARGPKPQVPQLQPFNTCILGSHNLHRTNLDARGEEERIEGEKGSKDRMGRDARLQRREMTTR